MTPSRPSTPSMCYTPVRGSSYQTWLLWGIPEQFDPWLTPADLWMTFDPAMHYGLGQGFFLPNLVAIGHSLAILPLVDPSWPLHDLRRQRCTTLWSGFLSTKFGGHRAFLSNLTPDWPQLTSLVWSLRKVDHKPQSIPYLSTKFQLDASKQYETHS